MTPGSKPSRPGWPSLKMTTASYPAATALLTFFSKVQVPRWTCGSVAEAGMKSDVRQPAHELAVEVAGMTLLNSGTRVPVTSPSPEYSRVADSMTTFGCAISVRVDGTTSR